MLTLLLLILLGASSCTSEYEERLQQGKSLKDRLEQVESSSNYLSDNQLEIEISQIKNEINLLAKVSGNEDLFLKEIFSN
ncbi:MAG: hypothetical protein COA33_005785 [Fluviicola sp.]|nr:hypothetical protein [Fluviicola sp.]